MQVRYLFLLIAMLTASVSTFAQTDSNVVKVDSSMKRPGTPPKIPVRQSVQKPQADTVFKDSTRLALERLPKQSAYRSLIFPGLGQLYNKRPAMVKAGFVKPTIFRYWKLPIIYTAYVIIGTQLNTQQKYYKKFLGELQYRQLYNTPRDPELERYDFTTLVTIKDLFRRNRDLCYMSFVIAHTVQVVDAYVDAKMFRYDISDELTFKISPSLEPLTAPGSSLALAPAVKLRLSF